MKSGLRASCPRHSCLGAGKGRRACNSSLEFEYLHRKSRCEMLIRGDDISNDIITLGTCFSMFVYIHARFRFGLTDWRKSDSSVDGEPQVEFKFQRRSCQLSFLFPPRRQSTPESLLAGFMKSSGLRLSNLRETTHTILKTHFC